MGQELIVAATTDMTHKCASRSSGALVISQRSISDICLKHPELIVIWRKVSAIIAYGSKSDIHFVAREITNLTD